MNLLLEKAEEVGLAVIKASRQLSAEKNWSLADQVLRSGTSIGANISESEFAQSRRDFISKLQIALKECNETLYWLRLLEKAELWKDEHTASLCKDIQRMLIASIKTAKKNIED